MSSILQPTQIKPYPYQEEAVRAILKEFREGKQSTLATLPTGTGKGFLMAWCSKSFVKRGMRALTLAHTKELVYQNANYHHELGVPTRIEMGDLNARQDNSFLTGIFAESHEYGDPVSVSATVQTMQGKRLESWPGDYFDLINTDECHHGINDTYENVYRRFPGAKRLMVTATPDRLDGQGLGAIAQSIAYHYPMRKAIAEGWLCRPKFVRCELQIDLRQFTKRKMKDVSDEDVAMAITPHIEPMANAIKAEIGDRRTIVFCPDIRTSGFMASALHSIGLEADAVWGVHKDRDRIIDAYKAGDFQVLCNAMLLTEGFDLPSTAAVVFCRPTMSRALMSQMAGRGLRRGKPDAILLDFTWVAGDSGLPDPNKLFVCPTELFDDYRQPGDVQQIAREILDKGDTDDVLEAVERAEKVYEERVKVKIKVREQKVRYRRVVYDPFAVMEAIGVPIRNESEASGRIMATKGQVETLKKFGVDGAEHMSRRRATVVLDQLIGRAKQGLASHKQVAHLIAQGVEMEQARSMTKKEATAYLESVWGPMPKRGKKAS